MDRNPMRTAMIMTTMLALTAASAIGNEGYSPPLPRLPAPKPKGYGVHLTKAERRGKSFSELQALREARNA